MKTAIKLTILALIGASSSVYAHELRGFATAVAIDNKAPSLESSSSDGELADEGWKERSATKRQRQRDARRARSGRYRSAAEDRREGERKRRQNRNSGRGLPRQDQDGGSRRWGDRSISRRENKRRRDAGFRQPGRRSRANRNRPRCNRSWCDDLNSEDADLMADFFETYEDEDIDLIADYLFDVYGDDESESSEDYNYY